MLLIFNDTEEKVVEKAVAALADMIRLEAMPPQSPLYSTYIKTILLISVTIQWLQIEGKYIPDVL